MANEEMNVPQQYEQSMSGQSAGQFMPQQQFNMHQ